MIIILMGVSGAGKSTVGRLLAHALGWTFVEADEYHPAANIDKMHRGIPLDDEDRRAWLEALRHRLEQARQQCENVVLACSALKHAYQHYLAGFDPQEVHYVCLVGSEDVIRQRLAQRKGHFMNPNLLHSQFETLEPPEDGIQIEINDSPETVVATICQRLGLPNIKEPGTM